MVIAKIVFIHSSIYILQIIWHNSSSFIIIYHTNDIYRLQILNLEYFLFIICTIKSSIAYMRSASHIHAMPSFFHPRVNCHAITRPAHPQWQTNMPCPANHLTMYAKKHQRQMHKTDQIDMLCRISSRFLSTALLSLMAREKGT